MPSSSRKKIEARGRGETRREDLGFTLLELLVVIGLMGILSGMLTASAMRAKETARLATCVNNLRQLGIAMKLSIDDHEFRFPGLSVIDADGRSKGISATIGGYDPAPARAHDWCSANRRPLFPYIKPSDVYRCPADKGQLLRQCRPNSPIKPSNFLTLGCSYQYNGGDFIYLHGGGFRHPRAGPLGGQLETWAPDPSRYILLHEPPARIYGCGAAFWTQWHFARGRTDITDPAYTRSNFISPILFVDGHASVHDFSKALTTDPYYPYEATKDWIWYKPAGSTP